MNKFYLIIFLVIINISAKENLPKKIAIFCASSNIINPQYFELAKELGKFCAENKIQILFGGANTGLMGALADSCLMCGGQLKGILPESGKGWNVDHQEIQELKYVATLYHRYKEFDEAEAFVVLPGGIGTLAESINIIAQKQMGIHNKPIIFININSFFDKLKELFNFMVNENVLKKEHLKLFTLINDLKSLEEILLSSHNGFLDHHTQWWTK